MQIIRLTLGAFETNCYLVEGEPGRCIVIDPADGGAQLLRELDSRSLTPEAVLLTHGHYDHILAVPDLQRRWLSLPVFCHPADCPEALTEYDMGQEFPTVTAFANVQPIAEGQELSFAGLTARVLETPGHTPGSVTFRIGDTLFTGDTLFYIDIGRTDFEGGSYPQMMRSLRRLALLDGDPEILPGHGPRTRLGYERRFNPYLKNGGGGVPWG